MIVVCVTGPESTGKTDLAGRLAEALDTEWVPEAARTYAESIGRPLTSADVEPIARAHISSADDAVRRVRERGRSVIVLDTDVISTIVYGRHYYGFSSEWLEAEASARLADLYLLCDVDLPWSPDGIRDRPSDRTEMLAEFARALQARDAPTARVTGTREERLRVALAAIARRMAPQPKGETETPETPDNS